MLSGFNAKRRRIQEEEYMSSSAVQQRKEAMTAYQVRTGLIRWAHTSAEASLPHWM